MKLSAFQDELAKIAKTRWQKELLNMGRKDRVRLMGQFSADMYEKQVEDARALLPKERAPDTRGPFVSPARVPKGARTVADWAKDNRKALLGAGGVALGTGALLGGGAYLAHRRAKNKGKDE